MFDRLRTFDTLMEATPEPTYEQLGNALTICFSGVILDKIEIGPSGVTTVIFTGLEKLTFTRLVGAQLPKVT
jgi:hypothetical protein